MRIAIPTLGTDGWITDPEVVADTIISSFITTNHSQSNLFKDANKSFQSILMKNTNNISYLEEDLIDILDKKLKASFGDDSYATVEINALEDKPDQFMISLVGTIFSEGKEYSITKLIQTENSRVIKINNINVGD